MMNRAQLALPISVVFLALTMAWASANEIKRIPRSGTVVVHPQVRMVAPHPAVQGNLFRPPMAVRPAFRNFGHPFAAPARPALGTAPGPHRHIFGSGQVFRPHADFRGRQLRTFRPHELALWRSGRWRHQRHHGRYGWWWEVDGDWYFYPAPIYPYPTVVSTDADIEEGPQPAAALGPPAPVFWYFCDNPQGYYPYIANCSTAWREVPATPPH